MPLEDNIYDCSDHNVKTSRSGYTYMLQDISWKANSYSTDKEIPLFLYKFSPFETWALGRAKNDIIMYPDQHKEMGLRFGA
jgi:hypothetical protein